MKPTRFFALLLIIALLGIVPGATAASGNRRGCIAILNNSGDGLTVYLSVTTESWHLRDGAAATLADPGGPVIVDENTVVWGTRDAGGTYPKQPLSRDPSSVYTPGNATNCQGGAWLKRFLPQ